MVRTFQLPLGATAKPLADVYVGAYAQRVIADGASYYWRLGETSGLTAVDSVGGANGTISGGVTLAQPGAISDGNKAMVFDGTTGKVVTTATVALPLIATVEAWVNIPIAATGQVPVFGTDAIGASGVYLGATYSGPPAPPLGWKLFCYSNAAATGSQNFSAGEWHHIVYALNGSNITFFIDGIAYPVLATGRALATTATASIGWCVNPNQFWNGSLDEVAIYPRALTAPEIAAHYALASAPAVDPAAADIPYRQLLLQAAGAPAYVGPLASVSAATGQPISTTAPTSLGPYATGPVKLSDLYAVGAGATLNLLGVPF